jgi:sugar phosphate isomerase/epimerase
MIQISVINAEISDNIEFSLRYACDLGIKQVELFSAWGRNIEYLDEVELKKLKGLIDNYGLTVPCISSTLFLRTYMNGREEEAPEIKGFLAANGNYQSHLGQLPQAFRAAEILGASLIRVFGFQKEGILNEDTFTLAAEKFSLPAKLAKEAGITLVMENCPHTAFGWGSNAAKLVQMIDSPAFRLLWDPAGGVRAGEPDCIEAMSEILALTAHVHAKDILVLPDGGREYLAVGKGQVPWKTITQALINNNYSGAISLEPHFKGQDGTSASAVKESLEGLRQTLSSL